MDSLQVECGGQPLRYDRPTSDSPCVAVGHRWMWIVWAHMEEKGYRGGEVEPLDPLPSVEKPDVNAGGQFHCAVGGLLRNVFLVPSTAGLDGSQMGSGPSYTVHGHGPGSSISPLFVGQG